MSPTPPVRDVHAGHYRFLPGIAPFSSGVVAIAGYLVRPFWNYDAREPIERH